MTKLQLSIIVPLYNCEKYIGNCLESIMASGLDEETYEIIIVDDGSTDNGAIVAQHFVDEFDNIHLIRQDNQGIGGARNTGIKHSKGYYIWVIDADDEINEHAIDVFNKLNEIEKLDVLGVQLLKVDKNRNPISLHCVQDLIEKNVIISGRDAILKGYNPSSACALLMRKGFLEEYDLQFKVGITHEDVEFSYRAMCKAQRVVFTKIVPYLYIRHGNTTSTPYDRERLLKYIIDDVTIADSFRSLSNELQNSDPVLCQKILLRSQSIVFGITYQMFKNRNKWNKQGINIIVLNELKRKGFYPLKAPFYSWKQRMVSCILNVDRILV